MKRSQRLSPVVDIAHRKTDEALKLLGESNALWQREQQQLTDLENYKQEYLDKLRQGGTLSMTARKVLEFRGFLEQLDNAIRAQQQQVNASLQRLTLHQKQWQQAHSKEQAMQSLVNRYVQDELQVELKQEQNDTDERNTSQWSRRQK
jgi:flagellar FliJ protein